MNWYKEAIKILEQDITYTDWRDLCVKIAMDNPSALVKAAGVKESPRVKATIECARIMREGSKVEAIRHCRNITGMGLKAAKEFVEAIKI